MYGGCGRRGGYPAPGGAVIAALNPGDEIIIAAGAGTPPQEADATATILEVAGMSALTTSGIRLMCSDGLKVTPTGNRVEPETLVVSPEAQAFLTQIS